MSSSSLIRQHMHHELTININYICSYICSLFWLEKKLLGSDRELVLVPLFHLLVEIF